ncbi:MAG: hypothetical protein GX885_07680 [Methanomicrobiales archaeon]|nr:hypothetical protein [Methanomicrobiales archaeon]
MTDIDQQKVAATLIAAIQALIITGFVACIVIGPQDHRPAVTSPGDEIQKSADRPGVVAPAAYDTIRQSGTWPTDPLPEVGGSMGRIPPLF